MPQFRSYDAIPQEDHLHYMAVRNTSEENVGLVECNAEGARNWFIAEITNEGALRLIGGLSGNGAYQTDADGCIIVRHPVHGVLNHGKKEND